MQLVLWFKVFMTCEICRFLRKLVKFSERMFSVTGSSTAVGVVVDTGLVQQMSVRPGSVQVAVGLDVVPVDGSA